MAKDLFDGRGRGDGQGRREVLQVLEKIRVAGKAERRAGVHGEVDGETSGGVPERERAQECVAGLDREDAVERTRVREHGAVREHDAPRFFAAEVTALKENRCGVVRQAAAAQAFGDGRRTTEALAFAAQVREADVVRALGHDAPAQMHAQKVRVLRQRPHQTLAITKENLRVHAFHDPADLALVRVGFERDVHAAGEVHGGEGDDPLRRGFADDADTIPAAQFAGAAHAQGHGRSQLRQQTIADFPRPVVAVET